MPPSALIFLAEGTEEMEFTITYDTLVRAGVRCHSVLVPTSTSPSSPTSGGDGVRCSRGVRIVPDVTLAQLLSSGTTASTADEHDAVVVPGGAPGAEAMCASKEVAALLRDFDAKGKVVAAICAGSTAIKAAGIARGKRITSHPSVKAKLEADYKYSEDRVVVDGNVVTSRGPGTAFAFALTLVEKLVGTAKRHEVEGPMVLPERL